MEEWPSKIPQKLKNSERCPIEREEGEDQEREMEPSNRHTHKNPNFEDYLGSQTQKSVLEPVTILVWFLPT